MSQIFGYSIPLPLWLTLLLVGGLWVALSFLLAGLFDRTVRRFAEKREGQKSLGAFWVRNLHGPILALLFLIGGRVVLSVVELTPELTHFVQVATSLGTALVLILVALKIYDGILTLYGERYEPLKPSLGILNLLGKGLIVVIGALITLDSLNISIAPLLTTLGIGGLAVALAFKDTLANFFAGLYILADRPIRVGDFVKLEGGPDGFVESVGWRSTRLRNLSGKIVIIPNSKVSESIITNYFLPDPKASMTLMISVGHDADTRKVERILLDEAIKAAGETEGMLADPPPMVRFIPGFQDSSLDFTLICQVREYVDQYFVQHELRHRILERFRREGIEIPFPQRRIHLGDEKG